MKPSHILCLLIIGISPSCKRPLNIKSSNADEAFSGFETKFLDSYWRQYPCNSASTSAGPNSISVGYGKYYEELIIPDSISIAANVQYSKNRIDSLNNLDFKGLTDNNKISFNIIRNQLESDIWYQTVFKSQQWDASYYNLSNESYYIIHQPYAPLDDRLRILSKHLSDADKYYTAAFKMLVHPTKESVGLSIMQNLGGLSIFGKDLEDSIKSSHLSPAEITALNQNLSKTVSAVKTFVDSLKSLLANKNYTFRKFSIGKDLFRDKFKFDLVTNFTPEEIYEKALAEKKFVTARMVKTSDSLWEKYFQNKPKSEDGFKLISPIISAITLQHAKGKDFYDLLRNQVYELKKFIIVRDLFDFDTTYPIIVRLMPEYERGFAIANAEFTPPYQKSGDTYFNIDDVTKYPREKMESTLREYNNFSSQLLSIHEAMPGHCLQGIYNNKKSPDVLRSVFQNGAMIEGWAVYSESMMLENGWANGAAEMQLMLDKLKLRELGNVIIDYQMQCLDSPKNTIMNLLVNELFQTQAQAEEKYHRATLSQVQLCSYYAGSSAIMALREEYKAKMGNHYALKDFHENFLKYGSSPVKYIRECMLE
jgi:uncharacterized protein (DUF885 family)